MTIMLPGELRGFAYNRVVPVEMNNFDVDLILSSFFFKAVTEGMDRAKRSNDPTRVREFINDLAHHRDLRGFDDLDGRQLLDRLVRTTLVQMGRRGQARTQDQILGVTEYSLLAFKCEFPTESSRLRRVDALIYRMMRDQFGDAFALRKFFEDVFGEGVKVRGGRDPGGEYDGVTQLDTLTRLSIAFLDSFEPTGTRPPREKPPREACPAVAGAMAQDLYRYLKTYHSRMPVAALTYHFKALIDFELLIYTLKLMYAVTALVEHPEVLPLAMQRVFTPSPPDLYLDFTGEVRGRSREMAAAAVRRDVEMMQRFIPANLTLRHLDRYVVGFRGNRRVAEMLEELLPPDDGGPEYLQALIGLMEHDTIGQRLDLAASGDIDKIKRENTVGGDDGELEVQNTEVELLVAAADTEFAQLMHLITESQRKQIASNVLKWFSSVGGLAKSHGILVGTGKSRQSWRYAPSNDLLATLVQLAAVDTEAWREEAPAPTAITLREFYAWLDRRFGIRIDRPPSGFAGVDYVAAAKENASKMLARLQQMGIFRDLSDDFTVQRLTPPYMVEREQGEQGE